MRELFDAEGRGVVTAAALFSRKASRSILRQTLTRWLLRGTWDGFQATRLRSGCSCAITLSIRPKRGKVWISEVDDNLAQYKQRCNTWDQAIDQVSAIFTTPSKQSQTAFSTGATPCYDFEPHLRSNIGLGASVDAPEKVRHRGSTPASSPRVRLPTSSSQCLNHLHNNHEWTMRNHHLQNCDFCSL